MVEDANPLFLDPDFARTTRYGEVIVPPVMIEAFAGNGGWPPSESRAHLAWMVPTRGERMVGLTQVMEFYKPARVGDRLSSQVVIEDVYEKPVRLDPKAVWIRMATRITNQDAELVAVVRFTVATYRDPDEVAADGSGIDEGRG
jgi:acyl dehydratase